ncbi:GumC family protein [Chryseobacterium sp. FH1]|uniref:GumC family protein n=1 Tax=Chryseobacterium sp. FH1 TaxID=1233951 RepID=UPI0004E3AF20|nr:tyrosine-protein kinase [Chryseobacterium sp. FH1]KFC20001.1 capsular biosynthesis protein [Chryseobacterium sp. FH1]
MDNVKERVEEINFRELIKPYLTRWHWFVISVFIMGVLAVVYTKFSTPIYSIRSSVLIKDAKKMSNASGDFGVLAGLGGFAGMGTNSIENELEVFKSKNILEDVARNLKLETSIFSREKYHDVELYRDTNPFNIIVVNEKEYEELPEKPVDITIKGDVITLSSEEFKKGNIVTTYNKMINLPYANFMIVKNPKFNRKKVKKLDLKEFYFKYSHLSDIVDDFQKSIDIDLLDKDATVIGLSLSYPNKDKAIDILDDMVRVYNLYATTDKNTESSKTKDFIDDRIQIISNELGEVETEKEQFKIDNNVIDIGAESRLNLQISTEAKRRMLDIDTQIEITNVLIDYVNSQGSNSYQLMPTNIGIDNSTSAASNISMYNKLILDRNRMLENATTENPLVVDITKEINALRGAMKESLYKNLASLKSTKSFTSGYEGSADNKMSRVPRQEKLFRNIERQQGIKENLYLLLLQKREEAAITMAITSDKARSVDSAYALKKPVAPKKMLTLLGAMIFGTLIPFAFIYTRELLNNKLLNKHDLDKLSSNPILSEIPRLGRRDDETIKPNDITPLAESFRILVTNLSFMLPKKQDAKVIFVTSTIKGEGKTFVSVNLSLALASPKRKVVVIGSDIRNPQLQRYNPSMKNVKGLTEFLYNDDSEIDDLIHPSGFNNNCDFIYSGSIPPNPTDLLQNGRYELLLESLKDKYDYIILDTAPLMLVTDSFLISSVADATIYVTRSEVTEKSFIEFANSNIDSNKIINVGFVVNDVHKTNFGYGNKYGYGYQMEEKKWWQIFKK